MNLTDLSVKRPIATGMAVAATLLLGAIGLWILPVDMMPQTESSTLTVFVGVRGGMPPEDIEKLITEPIEAAVSTMAGLKNILSISRKDRSTVTLEFDESSDVNRASLDVSERLARIKGKLPKEIEKPIVARYNENDQPVVILSATSSVKTPEVLRTMIEHHLKPQLSRVPGVANVEVVGGRQRKILVEFEKSKLEMHRLDIMEIIRELGTNNLSLASGQYDSGRDSMGVQFMGAFKTLDEMKQLGVSTSRDGSRVRLGDVAVVRDYYMEPESYSRINNQPSVSIYVQKESGANTIRVSENVIAEVGSYQKTLPSDIGIGVSIDQSVSIRQAISDVREALTLGALLTAMILWFFLGRIKQVGVIVLSIPVAVMGTFAVMMFQSHIAHETLFMLPVTLNVMSLLGVALGIGRMVDDSIVVFENITHRFSEKSAEPGFDSKKVAIEATQEMSLAVASSTLVMMVIFLPIVFISADVRRLFSDVAFTVVVSLLASQLMANTVVPLLASYLYQGALDDVHKGRYQWEIKLIQSLKEFWARVIMGKSQNSVFGRLKQGQVFFEVLPGVSLFSRAFLWRATAWCVRRRLGVLIGTVLSFVLSALLYTYSLEKEFLGETEKKEFVIFVELKAGTKLDVSDGVVAKVEAEINSMPEVKDIVKTVSAKVEGWSSKLYVTLSPKSERTKGVQEVIDELRPKLKRIESEEKQNEAFIYFSEPRSASELVIDVFGPDYLTLRDVAVDVAKRVGEVPGLHDVKLRYKPGRPEVRLEVDHARSSIFGLNSKDIADSLHAQLRGLRATYFNTGDDQVETVARLSEEDRRTLENVSNLSVMSKTRQKAIVPIQQMIQFEHGFTPSEVWRKDKERVIQVSANRERMALSTAVQAIQKKLVGYQPPIGYHYEIGGDYKKLVRSEHEFKLAFVIMLLLVYIVLACFFESYSQPFLMLLTVPLALAGSVPALKMTGTAVNMGVYIGFLMLGGTVVSNAVILIDRLNVVRKTRGLYRSVLKVGIERSRPIFMTSLSTIVAMIPLMLSRSESSDMWAPLALTVVSGMTLSSVLTLFVIPAAYVALLESQRFFYQLATKTR